MFKKFNFNPNNVLLFGWNDQLLGVHTVNKYCSMGIGLGTLKSALRVKKFQAPHPKYLLPSITHF